MEICIHLLLYVIKIIEIFTVSQSVTSVGVLVTICCRSNEFIVVQFLGEMQLVAYRLLLSNKCPSVHPSVRPYVR